MKKKFYERLKNIFFKVKKYKSPKIKQLKNYSSKLNLYEFIFAEDTKPKINRAFTIIISVIISYTLGKFTITIAMNYIPIKKLTKISAPTVIPHSRNKLLKKHVDIIANKDLFNAIGLPKAKPGKKTDKSLNLACQNSFQKSSLPIKIINTAVLQDNIKSVASVSIRNSERLVNVREGEIVSNMAKIGKIEQLKVIFRNITTGECEYIETKKGKSFNKLKPLVILPTKEGNKLINKTRNSAIKNVGNKFTIKKQFRDQMLEKLPEILTQALAIQIKNPDGTLSFKITNIVPGSIYSQLNIQEGDIITQINGKPINNVNSVMEYLAKIKEINQFELSVKRNNDEQKIEYNFE